MSTTFSLVVYVKPPHARPNTPSAMRIIPIVFITPSSPADSGPPDLLGVLDDADRWLTATGHFDWRAGVLLQRAEIHSDLGDTAMAVDLAQEALAAYSPDGPG